MKKLWFEPKIIEISTKMTAVQGKTAGTGDDYAPGDLSDWKECDCCS